ncbi:hypothetical protein J3B01_004606 [Coemansia erecta]|nr:hypothetical protein J3B01_004606 [Coemansia erecta]
MNLSGLSYLQFSLVDAFVAVYMLLRVHDTQSWASINPISVLRQGRGTRLSTLVTMLGFYSSLAATVLFLAKDGIMAGNELDDVNLCRAAVYLQQQVTPPDEQQLPDVKNGLLLWNLGTAFHLLSLGCVMYLWASAPLRKLLGRKAVMSTMVGIVMLGLGALGWVAVVAAHFATFSALSDNTANARSISRIVGSAFFLVFMALLAWVVGRVWLILRHTRRRDPLATATLVSTTQKLHAQGGYPLATLQYLLGIQMLSFMNSSAILLVLVLFLRALFFLIFDISFLTPERSAILSLAANNAYTGIGTLAASLVSVLVVQILFPCRQDIMVDVLSMASELAQPERMAFIDAQLKAGSTVPMPRLTTTMTSRDRMLSNAADSNSRSRAPTSASLAVEKLMSSTNLPATNPESEKYLDEIPYIDRDGRENSFFSQGPWSHPVTHTLSAMHTGDRDSSTVSGAGFSSPLGGSRNLEEIVRSNTGSSLITVEGRQDMLRHAVLKNEQSRSQVLSTFVPLSSSNLALATASNANTSILTSSAVTTATQQSGLSLHAEALQDPDNGARPDSIVSSYIRPDNAMPPPRRMFAEPRPSSFVSEDYQYDPTVGLDDDKPKNPFVDEEPGRTAEPQSVYVATPAADDNVDDFDADDTQGLSGIGPILIRKGSKASLRRKGTIERRRQRRAREAEDMQREMQESSASDMQKSSQENSSESIALEHAVPSAPESKPRTNVSRMSAFNGSPNSLPALLEMHGQEDDIPNIQRDSSTISIMPWEQKNKDSVRTAATHQLQGTNHPASLFRQSIGSAISSRHSNDVFASASSLNASATNDMFASASSMHGAASFDAFASASSMNGTAGNGAFFTPEASVAQVHDDLRPSTAPSTSQRHTLAPHEHMQPAISDADDDIVAGGGRLRRAQTLRKAVDTDASAMESSIGDTDTGDLISALPMPSQPSNERFII